MGKFVSRRLRTKLSVSHHCLVFVRIFRKILSGVCLLSGFCCQLSVRIFLTDLSTVWILTDEQSGFQTKPLSIVYLSGRTRTRRSCPDLHCPFPPTSYGYKFLPKFDFFVIFLEIKSEMNQTVNCKSTVIQINTTRIKIVLIPR